MTALELAARRAHRHMGDRPWQRFGICSVCGRSRDEEDRPLFVTGRRRSKLECLDCFDLAAPPRRRAA